MLFFRSEEAINDWCESNGQPRQPTATIQQLWELSKAWYGNRLSPDARRPQAEEVREIFVAAGLEGPFWDTGADRFQRP